MPFITTQIEIAASPEEVRKTFLDFDSYPAWAKGHLVAVEVTSGDKDNLKAGDKLKITLTGATFPATVLRPVFFVNQPNSTPKTNTPEEFKWRGSLPYIFTGDHSFQFRPSPTTAGQTLLVQEENFSGLLSFLVAPGWSQGEKTKAGFEKLNLEIKERVELRGQ